MRRFFSLAKLRCEHKTREIMYPWAWGCGAKRDESAQSRGLRSIKIPFLSFALPAHSLLVKLTTLSFSFGLRLPPECLSIFQTALACFCFSFTSARPRRHRRVESELAQQNSFTSIRDPSRSISVIPNSTVWEIVYSFRTERGRSEQ
jgi:hypothetical protein